MRSQYAWKLKQIEVPSDYLIEASEPQLAS